MTLRIRRQPGVDQLHIILPGAQTLGLCEAALLSLWLIEKREIRRRKRKAAAAGATPVTESSDGESKPIHITVDLGGEEDDLAAAADVARAQGQDPAPASAAPQPREPDLLERLAEVAARGNAELLKFCDGVLGASPFDAELHYRVGRFLEERNFLSQAFDAYRTAAVFDPGYRDVADRIEDIKERLGYVDPLGKKKSLVSGTRGPRALPATRARTSPPAQTPPPVEVAPAVTPPPANPRTPAPQPPPPVAARPRTTTEAPRTPRAQPAAAGARPPPASQPPPARRADTTELPVVTAEIEKSPPPMPASPAPNAAPRAGARPRAAPRADGNARAQPMTDARAHDEPADRAPPIDAKLRADIVALALRLDQLTHFDLLGVSATPSAQDVNAAYVKFARRFHPDRLMAAGLRQLAPDAERLLARAAEAAAVLSDPKRRAAYVAAGAGKGRR